MILCRFCWWPVATTTLTLCPALNSSSPPPPPGATPLLSPQLGTVWGAPHWTIKWWWQVQTEILWYLCVTNYFTNIIIHYTMQGASTEMAASGTTILTTRTCWNMTSRRENGTRLGPCQSSGASMPLLSSITTPLRNTAIDVISYKLKKNLFYFRWRGRSARCHRLASDS